MKKVLVMEADGFIGRNLVKGLIRRGTEAYATIYPRHNTHAGENAPNLHVYSLNLNRILNRIVDFPKDVEVIYHSAWNGMKPEIRNELDIQIGNVDMSLDYMELVVAIEIRRIVFPGSTNECLYYGKPLNEEALPSPHGVYGAAKIAFRCLCSDFASRDDIGFVYTIIADIYATDRRNNNAVFYITNKLLYYEESSLTKLEQLWDCVYIDDVVSALVAVGERGKNGAVYAIDCGDNWSLRNYIRVIHRKADLSLSLDIDEIPYNSSKLSYFCIDLTDIRRDTDFEPRIDSETGISRVIDCVRGDIRVGR